MSKLLPALALRVVVVTTATAAAALLVVLPTTPPVVVPVQAAIAFPAVATAPTVVAMAGTTVPAATTVTAARVEPTVALVGSTAPMAASASALRNALGKIGAPYRWGATGPNAFDCSGLVLWAYQAAGISLPRTSREMSLVGTAVTRSQLRPGDLVFFYTPVRHVGLYVGDGKVVHASTARSPVKISDISGMPFHSARRV